MLVLSRKVDQEIMIGNDIKVTIVRVEGNRVRLGISAPREVTIVRGELAPQSDSEGEVEFELSEREFAFAHQQATDKISASKGHQAAALQADHSEPQLFSGRVAADGGKVSLKEFRCSVSRANPLAGFVSAT